MYLTQGLHRAVQLHPRRLATVDGERRTSWATLQQQCAILAAALARDGLTPGDRVGLLALNSDFHSTFFLGCWWGGQVAVPLNTRWSLEENRYAIEESGLALLFVGDDFLAMAASLKEAVPGLTTVVHVGAAATPAGMTSWVDWCAGVTPVPDRRLGGDHLAALMYTGGTTGFPKAVMLSHRNLWASAITRSAQIAPLPHHVALYSTPMFHIAGLGKLVSQVIVAGTSVSVPAFRPDQVMAVMAKEGVNDVVWVPSMLQMLLDHPSWGQHDLSGLQRITYGASPMSLALLERAQKAFPHAQFAHSYGMTEAAPVVTLNPWANHLPEAWASGRVRSAGQPGWCIELRILDEHGQEVPRGTVGEITVRGPNIMQGYWRQPQATAEALRDGWLHTGDGGYLDEDGYLYVVDRIKDMIISGGENVYSAEVEQVLGRHPAVQSCAVIGIPSPEWGEAVHAVVVRRPQHTVTEDALRAFCRQALAGYKVPKSIAFVEALPLSGAGKVLKQALRAPWWPDSGRQVS